MSDIVERLRGIYRVQITDGLGKVDGNLETDNVNEFVRQFPSPPIQIAAADEITRLRQLLSEAEKREAKAKRIAANAEAYGYDHGLEAAATLLDKVADKQKLAWDAHIASGSGNAATSHEAIYRSLASQIRALQSEGR